jgi:hypothetical protein
MAERIDLDASGRGLGQLVVAVLQVLHELLERQAIRRMDADELTDRQVEEIGTTLQAMRRQLAELQHALSEPKGGYA